MNIFEQGEENSTHESHRWKCCKALILTLRNTFLQTYPSMRSQKICQCCLRL